MSARIGHIKSQQHKKSFTRAWASNKLIIKKPVHYSHYFMLCCFLLLYFWIWGSSRWNNLFLRSYISFVLPNWKLTRRQKIVKPFGCVLFSFKRYNSKKYPINLTLLLIFDEFLKVDKAKETQKVELRRSFVHIIQKSFFSD